MNKIPTIFLCVLLSLALSAQGKEKDKQPGKAANRPAATQKAPTQKVQPPKVQPSKPVKPERVPKSAEKLDFVSSGAFDMKAVFQKHPEFENLVREDIRLERETKQLVKKARESRGKAYNNAVSELERVVTEHFHVRQAKRLYELKLMEERIEELRGDIQLRESRADKIVKKRLEELLQEGDDLKF